MAIKKDGERSENYVLDKITLNMWTILVKVFMSHYQKRSHSNDNNHIKINCYNSGIVFFPSSVTQFFLDKPCTHNF